MANKCHVCLLALIIFCLLLTGIGVEETHVFCSPGENVHLPCNNAFSNCTSTTWNYNRDSETVELVTEGIISNNRKRHERLSLGSDCSLNVTKVAKEDYGSYACRQYGNGQGKEDNGRVYLHVLQVSSSSVIRPGRSVTLSCQLDFFGVTCYNLVEYEGVQLMWVNQAGVNLMTDSRYQILFSSSPCIITLTTTLLNEDHNREWRCQLTQRNQLKTSVTYAVKYSDAAVTPVIPDTFITNSEDPSTLYTSVSSTQVIVTCAVFAALAVVIVAVLICKKRADNKRATDSAVVKDVNDHKGTYETINLSIPSSPDTTEKTDDVTYTEVMSSGKKTVRMENDLSYDTVTYAAIRGTESVLQDGLYASVNK